MRYIELSEFLEWLKNGGKEYPTIYTEDDIFNKHKDEFWEKQMKEVVKILDKKEP